MTSILEMPDDTRFWVITWVDQVWLHHAGTGGCGLTVFLQELPVMRREEVAALDQAQIAAWLTNPEGESRGTIRFATISVRVAIGMLPLLGIGTVIHRRDIIGSLPTVRARTVLTRSDDQRELSELRHALPTPTGWTSSAPYRRLLRYEYGTVSSQFARSRYLLHSDGTTDYIIPRTEIFRRFYAPHSEMARAFTRDRWSVSEDDLVYKDQLASGLKTRRDPETGAWHIIVQTHVPDAFVRWVALLFFDDYARSCAEQLHAVARSDRASSMMDPWYCSARIPLRASDKQPLTLQVRGWPLRTWQPRNSAARRQKFLVTDILSCTVPAYLPEICWERFNSGIASDHERGQVERATRSFEPATVEADPEISVTNAVDAHAGKTAASIEVDQSFWSNGPSMRKLRKESHLSYTGPCQHPPIEEPDPASPGERTYRGDAVGEARIGLTERDHGDRFAHLCAVFEELVAQGVLRGMHIVAPTDVRLRLVRSALDCWNMFACAQRLSQRPLRRCGIGILQRASGRGADATPARARSALILHLRGPLRDATWIEIETKSDQERFCSVLLVGDATNDQALLVAAVAGIVAAEGRNLDERLQPVVDGRSACTVHAVVHDYDPPKSTALSPRAALRALAHAQVTGAQRLAAAHR